MDNYEQQVRVALVNEFTNRARQVYSNDGLVAVMRKDIGDSITGALDKLVQAEEINALEANNVGAKLIPALVAEYTPDKMAQRVADLWMHGKSDYEAQFGPVFQELGEQTPKGIKILYDALINLAEHKSNIVNTLVEKARKDGISEAVNVQTIHAAIRKEFPTAEEYVNGINDSMSAISQLGASFSSPELQDSAIGKIMPTIMEKSVQLYMDSVIKADVKVLYKK